MTAAEASQWVWDVAGPIAAFLGAVAVLLLGLALLAEITR